MKLLLITGFLGSGKTTFIKRLLPIYANEKVALIVNEFGKVGVDGTLLERLGATMREISGGSVFCSCRLDQFENALHQAAAENPTMILVEASGLSDPTAVRTIVAQTPEIDYAGCIALCDAQRVEKALAAVRVCPKQLAVSDLILLNKVDTITPEETARLIALIHARFAQARVEPTTEGRFQPEWLEGLKAHAEAVPYEDTRDITLQKACVTLSPSMTARELEAFLRLFAEDTYRVKGFVTLAEGVYQVDCVGAALSVKPYAGERPERTDALVALAGKGMALRKALLTAQKWYPQHVNNIQFG